VDRVGLDVGGVLQHATATKIEQASADVTNAFNKLDVAAAWGDGTTVAADGSQIDTWENNLLAETSVRYGGYGGIAHRHISYIALFSRFIPCGVWEAVYIIDGLLVERQAQLVHAHLAPHVRRDLGRAEQRAVREGHQHVPARPLGSSGRIPMPDRNGGASSAGRRCG
jgi:hypothetical protein